MPGSAENVSYDGLPQDVMKSIFINLSPRDLVISMGVCKTWRAIIRDSSLAYKHLKHSREAAPIPDQKARLVIECSDITKPHYPVLGSSCDVMFDDIRYRVVNSCDGLVLLSTKGVCGRELLLWNPAIRKVKHVPACGDVPILDFNDIGGWSSLRMPFLVGVSGLGCIEEDGEYDYKIVQILCSYDEPGGAFLYSFEDNLFDCCYAMVYSLSSNCWRRIKSTPPRDVGSPKEDVVFVNDSVHWILVDDGLCSTIVGFDLWEETFWDVSIPDAPDQYGWNLLVCQGLLGAVMENLEDGPQVEIWVMKEHGEEDSWCKQFVVGPMSSVEPVRCMKYEKVLLEQRFDEVYVCYSKDRHLRDVEHVDDLTLYLESLALLGDVQSVYKECKCPVRKKKKRPRIEGDEQDREILRHQLQPQPQPQPQPPRQRQRDELVEREERHRQEAGEVVGIHVREAPPPEELALVGQLQAAKLDQILATVTQLLAGQQRMEAQQQQLREEFREQFTLLKASHQLMRQHMGLLDRSPMYTAAPTQQPPSSPPFSSMPDTAEAPSIEPDCMSTPP